MVINYLILTNFPDFPEHVHKSPSYKQNILEIILKYFFIIQGHNLEDPVLYCISEEYKVCKTVSCTIKRAQI